MTQKRIKVDLKTSFVANSPMGEVFEYLKETYGSDWRDVIANAVFAFYRPAAIATLGGSRDAVEAAIRRAQLLLEEKAISARNDCKPVESTEKSSALVALPAAWGSEDDENFFALINSSHSLEDES